MLGNHELEALGEALAMCGPAISELPFESTAYRAACDDAAQAWLGPVVEDILRRRVGKVLG